MTSTAPEYISYLKARIDELSDNLKGTEYHARQSFKRLAEKSKVYEAGDVMLSHYKGDYDNAQRLVDSARKTLRRYVRDLNECRAL